MSISPHSHIDTTHVNYGCSSCLMTGPRYSGYTTCNLGHIFTKPLTSLEISTRQLQPVFVPIFRPQSHDYNSLLMWHQRIGHMHYHLPLPNYQLLSDDTNCDSSSDDDVPVINHLFALDVSSLPPLVLNDGSLSSSSSVSSDDHLDLAPLRDELQLIDRMDSADLQSLFASMTDLDAVILPEPVQHDLPSLRSRTTDTSSDGDTVSTLNPFWFHLCPTIPSIAIRWITV